MHKSKRSSAASKSKSGSVASNREDPNDPNGPNNDGTNYRELNVNNDGNSNSPLNSLSANGSRAYCCPVAPGSGSGYGECGGGGYDVYGGGGGVPWTTGYADIQQYGGGMEGGGMIHGIHPGQGVEDEGPRVSLEDRELWEKFNGLTNEMIVTKSGSYYLYLEGRRLEVCKCTFLTTFGEKRGTIEYLQQKIREGDIFIKDGRGKSPHPNPTPAALKLLIKNHINGFQQYPNHYSRRRVGQFFLSSDLNLDRMFSQFVTENPLIPDVQRKEQLYRSLFRQSGLRIGQPRSDTCKICDNLYIQLVAAQNPAGRLRAEEELSSHHNTADDAYRSMNADILRAKNDQNFVVWCGDLQQQLLVMLIIQHLIVCVQEIIIPLFLRKTTSKMEEFLQRRKPAPRHIPAGARHQRSSLNPATVLRAQWTPSLFGLTPLDPTDPRIEMSRFEGKMDTYNGSFDDYLQLYIQFGYVFLFSPTLPWASAVAVVVNCLLISASAFKLCQVFQRPVPKRAKDIGAWQAAFEIMGVLSVMTNCGLIVLSNVQHNDEVAKSQRTSTEKLYLTVIVSEHLLVGLKIAVSRLVPDVPYWVKVATARQEYKAKVAFKKEQLVKSRRRLSIRYQVINQMLRERYRHEDPSLASTRHNSQDRDRHSGGGGNSSNRHSHSADGQTHQHHHSGPHPQPHAHPHPHRVDSDGYVSTNARFQNAVLRSRHLIHPTKEETNLNAQQHKKKS